MEGNNLKTHTCNAYVTGVYYALRFTNTRSHNFDEVQSIGSGFYSVSSGYITEMLSKVRVVPSSSSATADSHDWSLIPFLI